MLNGLGNPDDDDAAIETEAAAAAAAAAVDDGDDPQRPRLSSEDGEADRGATVAWTKLFGDDDLVGRRNVDRFTSKTDNLVVAVPPGLGCAVAKRPTKS